MIKNIKYNGMTTVPSDYGCPDGELAISMNMALDDSEIRAIRKPSELCSVADGLDVLYVHKNLDYQHFIAKKNDPSLICPISIVYKEGSMKFYSRYETESLLVIYLYNVRNYVTSSGEIQKVKKRISYTIPKGTTEMELSTSIASYESYEFIGISPESDDFYTFQVKVEGERATDEIAAIFESSHKVTFLMKYPNWSDVNVNLIIGSDTKEITIPSGNVEYSYESDGTIMATDTITTTSDDKFNYAWYQSTSRITDRNQISWYASNETRFALCYFTIDNPSPVVTKSSLTGIEYVYSIGNIVIVSTGVSMLYLIWDMENHEYKYLGRHIPEAKIKFTSSEYFKEDGSTERKDYFYYRPYAAIDSSVYFTNNSGSSIPTSTNRTVYLNDDEQDEENAVKFTTRAFGYLNKLLADAKQDGMFVMPRLLRFAYRLYDGSYVQYSSPILIYNTGTSQAIGSNSNISNKFCAAIARYYLDYYIENIDEIKKWSDIIKGITFFLSSDIYDFDQNGTINQLKFIKTYENKDFSYAVLPEINEGTQIENVINTHEFYKAFDIDLDDYHSGYAFLFVTGSYDNASGTITIKINSGGTDIEEAIDVQQNSSLTDIYDSIYNAFMNYGITVHKIFISNNCLDKSDTKTYEHNMALAFIGKEKPTSFVSCTYVKDSTASGTSMNVNCYTLYGMPIFPDKLPLNTLETGYAISDDYMSHNMAVPHSIYGYNSRIVYGNIDMYYYSPVYSGLSGIFHFDSTAGYLVEKNVYYEVVGLWYYIRVNGEDIVVKSDASGAIPLSYLYYPDTRCYKCVAKIEKDNSSYYISLPMKSSDYLNGSVFFSSMPRFNVIHFWSTFTWGDGKFIYGIDLSRYIDDTISEDPTQNGTYELMHNIIMNSEVNNPFCFKAAGYCTVGNGIVIGLSSATTAMSQGQFGQYPVYAFCSDGVYSLSISDEGYFSSVRPTTRDVCLSEDSICQTDDSVIFATDKGLMVITGSTSACMSQVLDESNFSITSLPGYAQLVQIAEIPSENLMLADFKTYVKDSYVMYDYGNMRILVINTDYTYAYLYSQKSGSWAVMENVFEKRLNSYPETLAVSNENKIISVSSPSDETFNGLLITRPFTFDQPDVHKSVYKTYQRGKFVSGHIKVALYASNNLYDWTLVDSSVDGDITGIGGTAYKYYRIAVVSTMGKDEFLTSFSSDVEAKYTNMMR